MLKTQMERKGERAMELNERITQARKRAHLSQEQLGERLGVSRQAVSKWESGQTNPDVSYVAQMCQILAVSPEWLLLGREPSQPSDSVYCAHCGAHVPVGSVFCPQCGKKLADDTPCYTLVLERPLRFDDSIQTLYEICTQSGHTPAFPLPSGYTREDIRAVAANAPQILFRGLTLEQAHKLQQTFYQPSNFRVCPDPTGDAPLSQLMDQPAAPPAPKREEKHGMSFGATVGAVVLGVICAVLILSFL